ncbi:MAG: RDD family protein [Streptosporangiaceae bacterium]
MSDYPGQGGGQEAVQPPPGQPYPQSAPTQFNPQINPPPWQDQQYGQQQQQYGQQQQPYGQQQYGQQPPPGFPQAPPIPAGYGYGQPGGLPVPAGMYLDQQSGLMLPQGTVLASSGRRIGAFFLAIPLAIITLGIGYVIWGLISWGNGQTPALQVLGMRCYRPEDNRVPGFWWMALRNIVGRIADGILSIVTELISLIFMLSRPDRKTLHDMVAGTVVLYDPNKVLAQQPPR